MATPFPFTAGQVLTAAQMNSIGEAYIDYSPTATSTVGTLTTVAATGSYTQVNKLVFVRFSITITTNGTGSGAIRITLPVTASSSIVSNCPIGVGRENSLTGNMLQVTSGSTTTANIFTYVNGYPGGSGASILGTIIYEAA